MNKEAQSPPAAATTTLSENIVSEAPPKKATNVPSSKGHRPWKQPKQKRSSAQRHVASLKLSLDQKVRRREKKEALRKAVQAAREADKTAKDAERNRRAEKKKTKEENVRKGAQQLVITNPKKLAKMSKKQYLNYVHRNKVLN